MPRKLTEIEAWEVIRKTFYKGNATGSGPYECVETSRSHYGMCSVVYGLYDYGRITDTVQNRMLRKIQTPLLDGKLYLYDLDDKGAAKRRSFCNARIKELKNESGNKRRNRSARSALGK
jgi:hypothetical protein